MTSTAFGNEPTITFDEFEAGLKQHQICFVVPAGAKIDAHTIELPGGILILGAVRGKIICQTGSAIIKAGGEFQGVLDVNDCLIEGQVTSPEDASGRPIPNTMSMITARGSVDATGRRVGGIVAISSMAKISANLRAHSYSVNRAAHLMRSTLQTLQ